MMRRIHQLPAAIANQIAAGEVIERPASVVKELLENAFDAGADAITVEIGYGGLNQIKISDNGSGILAEDLPLALAAHATSKISTLNDLYAIDSMGFRGEALASIASIAKVTISSRPAQQEHAMMWRIHNGEAQLTPTARTIGTTIDVTELFFNAPVRKRFLKSEQLEFQAIEMVIKRFALSAPHIALLLKHNGKQVLALPSAHNEQAVVARMTQLFGNSFVKEAIYLDVERAGMRLVGWISGQLFQRSQNDRQWVYINKRMVKDKLINHALKQAYDGLLHPGRFPACLLYLTIDTGEVDVNVHPTKHEVRFAQPRLVHDFISSQLAQALECSQVYVPIPVSEVNDVCEPSFDMGTNEYVKLQQPKPLVTPIVRHMTSLIRERSAVTHQLDEAPWVILNSKYALLFLQQRPFIVNVVGLYQQFLLNQLQAMTLPLANRPLLVPVTCCFKLDDSTLPSILSQLGIQVELVSHDSVLIRSLPIMLPYLDIRLFLDSISALQCDEASTLFGVLSHSQVFDLGSLSMEERMELNQLLLITPNQDLFCKVLTEDDCRMFLNA